MKKQQTQSGFAAVELVLILIILALIGVVGWQVFKNRTKTSNNTSPSASQTSTNPDAANNNETVKTADPYEGWKAYSNNKLEFKYPSDWTLDEQSVLVLKSSDYTSTGLQSVSVTKGASIMFSQSTIPQTNVTATNYKESSQYNQSYTNYKTLDINGKTAVQYNVAEDVINTVLFRKDGTRIEAQIQYATSNKEETIKLYNLILTSISVS